MRVILLGYSGLIGGHILSELAKNVKKNPNLDVICVGRNIRNQPYKNNKIKYVKWNFLDFNKLKLSFFKKENIIINCIGKNYSNSENLKKINVLFINKLLRYIQYNQIIVRFIHLGSVSVYGAEKKYINKIENIKENSQTYPDDLYSKSKLETEKCIQKFLKINKQNFSFTILRIANVFSDTKNPLSFKLIYFFLNKGIWIKCSDNTNYHFIHVKDIALVVLKCILNFKKTRNKIYNVSDDINQYKLHKIYAIGKKLSLFKIPISLGILSFIIQNFPLPKKMLNLFLTISSQVNYNNDNIKKELNFRSNYSLRKILFTR